MNTSECCPPADVSRWDEKIQVWKGKLFLRDTVIQILHIPLNMSAVVARMFRKIGDAHARPDSKDFLMLCYDPSPWKSEIYMTVTKNVPGGDMTELNGTFVSKVYDGPYNHVPKWIEDLNGYLTKNNQKAMRYYFHFSYCPKCAKKYGHNYCIAFAQVK